MASSPVYLQSSARINNGIGSFSVYWILSFVHMGYGDSWSRRHYLKYCQNNSAVGSYTVLVRPNESRIKILVHNRKSSYCSTLGNAIRCCLHLGCV
ncbi:unnamed protein product [Citrullus colocynthis]|uniref:Uncharacterized protein n=1 Tax=Citrullus colocynthis TaxID=252529 RepID=A0ABP0XYP9_9ROSI